MSRPLLQSPGEQRHSHLLAHHFRKKTSHCTSCAVRQALRGRARRTLVIRGAAGIQRRLHPKLRPGPHAVISKLEPPNAGAS